jgi:hypothetical protein
MLQLPVKHLPISCAAFGLLPEAFRAFDVSPRELLVPIKADATTSLARKK